jgi:hypothetical protein
MKTIKYILILIAGMCLTNIKSLAQSNNAETTETSQPTTSDSAKINKPAAQVNQFQEESNIIKNDPADATENVGILKLSGAGPVSIYLYSNKEKTGRTVTIDRVYLNIQDGYIIQIQAFAGNEIFMNMQSPVSINSRRFSSEDYLKCINCKNAESVIMEDFLSYISLKPFAPNDDSIWLKTPPDKDTSNTVTLKKGVSINSVLDLRLYTDALGLFNATPNAIVETDVRFKQNFKTNIIKGSGASLFHYFKLNFNASKFDSKNNVESADSSVFSRTSLLQKSYINGELAINIVQDWISKNSLSIGYIDAGGGINIGNIARTDTVSKTTDTVAVTTRNIFTELGVNLKTSSNIGCNIYLREMVDFSPQTKFHNENPVWFTKIGGEVYFNPFGNPASRIFGRMNYVFSTNWSEHQNHFFQFQFGYSVLLSSLINK